MTMTNSEGGVVDTDPDLCTACVLAKMLERGVASVSIEAGHSECEGTEETPCGCGCDYSMGVACKECRRKGTELADNGQCVDKRDCGNAIIRFYAEARAERTKAAAAAPSKSSGGRSSGKPRPCKCGCGEQTGGGFYRPGHDARHVSKLTSEYDYGKAGSGKTLEECLAELAHSDKLVAKFRKAIGEA